MGMLNSPDTADNLLLKKQIEVMLELQTKKFVKEFNQLQSVIQGFGSELQILQKRFSDLQNQKESQVFQKQPLKSEQKTLKQESNNTEEEFSPENISIDKIFYCGKK